MEVTKGGKLNMEKDMDRRKFISALTMALGATACAQTGELKGKKIILRSSWQTVNIGDIAHTPGVLHILEQHMPEVEVMLWPSSVKDGVEEMLMARFPKLKILQRSEVSNAIKEADFLLHGSGPSIVAYKDILRWKKETTKPYGIYGVTFGRKEQIVPVVNDAEFMFFRDSRSLAFAKKNGATCPIMEFGPDGAFACDLRDDETALKFITENGLEKGKFLCCIPRYRYTPYWLIKKGRKLDPKRDARNQQMKEHDHAPLRKAIEEVVRKTDHKVLICPEDQTQMAIGKEMLYDKLPKDILDKVVWRENYWLTNEALSTYHLSSGLFGMEMHSPIMCIGSGIPAIVGRFEEQTSKGFMWEDIGLKDWLFDMDNEEQVAKYPSTVLSLVTDREETMKKAARGKAFVEGRQKATMNYLKSSLKV